MNEYVDILALGFLLPVLAALLCFALNSAVPTRRLGAGAAAALLICGAALLLARVRGALPMVLLDQVWVAIEGRSVAITLRLHAANWALALLVLAGGAMALLALATALPRDLRGFGRLFGSATLALLAVVAGIADQTTQFLPFLWATAALLVFLALRSSGALAGSDAPVIVLLAGICGALLALGATLLASPAGAGALVCWTLLGLLALGAPPFQAPLEDLSEAPAALAGALLALGLPLLGGFMLVRFFADVAAPLAPGWQMALVLLGLATLLVCAAGAVGATRLRRLLAWQLSAQMGSLLIAIGLGGAALKVVAPALLVNAAMATLTCYLATAALERGAGTDDLSALTLAGPLGLPGLVFFVGAASAIGLPGTWGLWPRRWLIDELLRVLPWGVAPLLAGSALLALAFVAPLATFWRHIPPARLPRPRRGSGATRADSAQAAGSSAETTGAASPRRESTLSAVIAALSAAPLVILGVFPQVAWNGWLAQAAPLEAPPALPGAAEQLVGLLVVLGLAGLAALARFDRGRAIEAGAEPLRHGVLGFRALGESLRGLAWAGGAQEAFAGLWRGLLWASHLARRSLALFEQRYYLASLVIAVIVVMMLFIQ